jgi:hypothetical protein
LGSLSKAGKKTARRGEYKMGSCMFKKHLKLMSVSELRTLRRVMQDFMIYRAMRIVAHSQIRFHDKALVYVFAEERKRKRRLK